MDFQAPKDYGTYAGSYLLRNPDGELFGEQPFYNVIHVGEPGRTEMLEKAQSLSLGECFDLDSGSVIDQGNPLCDFSLNSMTNSGLIEFTPDYYASFAFTDIYTYKPDLSQCHDASLSSETRYVDLQDWYVCYRSNAGHYGWLHFNEMQGGKIIFDWKRFEEE